MMHADDQLILTNRDWLALIPALSRANRSLAEYKGMLRACPTA